MQLTTTAFSQGYLYICNSHQCQVTHSFTMYNVLIILHLDQCFRTITLHYLWPDTRCEVIEKHLATGQRHSKKAQLPVDNSNWAKYSAPLIDIGVLLVTTIDMGLILTQLKLTRECDNCSIYLCTLTHHKLIRKKSHLKPILQSECVTAVSCLNGVQCPQTWNQN